MIHRRLWTPLILCGLLALSALLYWPGTQGGFTLDDYGNIVHNPALKIHNLRLKTLLRASFSDRSGPLYRPISMLTFALDIYTNGLDPHAMKRVNLAIQLLNGVLVFILIRLILGVYARTRDWPPSEGKRDAAALLVAGIWLLAPINLTSVLYIVQRMTLLAGTFTLLGLICWILGRERLHQPQKHWSGVTLLAVTALIAIPLAVLSKEIGALTLLYGLVLEWVFFRFRRPDGRISKTVIGYFILFLVVPGLIGLAWITPAAMSPAGWAARPFTMGERVLTEGRVIWHYVYWSLIPNPQVMSLFHDDFPISTSLFTPWSSLPAWFGIAALLAAGIYVRHRAPLLSLGILWFLAGQTMTASFIPLELVFEHREYLPDLGLYLGLIGTIVMAVPSGRFKRLAWGAAGCYLLLGAGGLALRAQSWSNPLLFYLTAATDHPRSPRATYGLGRELAVLSYSSPKLLPEATKALEKASRVPNQNANPDSALILTAEKFHRTVHQRWYRQMAQILSRRTPGPQDVAAISVLVNCAISSKHTCHLNRHWMQVVFAAALAHRNPNPDMIAVYGNYQLNVLRNPQAADRTFNTLVTLSPGRALYHYDLGVSEAAGGQFASAEQQLAKVRRLDHLGIDAPLAARLKSLIRRLDKPDESTSAKTPKSTTDP